MCLVVGRVKELLLVDSMGFRIDVAERNVMGSSAQSSRYMDIV